LITVCAGLQNATGTDVQSRVSAVVSNEKRAPDELPPESWAARLERLGAAWIEELGVSQARH
jgi:hypothetical protein